MYSLFSSSLSTSSRVNTTKSIYTQFTSSSSSSTFYRYKSNKPPSPSNSSYNINPKLRSRLQKQEEIHIPENNKNVKVNFTSKKQLMRDFIQDSLYNKEYGYFTSKEVITSIDKSRFKELNTLKNRKDYLIYLSELYKDSQHSWFTPVEIFQPYYSNAIGRYIIEKYNNSKMKQEKKPLKIFEVGAGSGTNALCILNFLRDQHPNLYATAQYTIIEISRLLAVKQLERIKVEHPNIKVQVYNTSIFNWTHKREDDECFILMTEVIDNLPHDKIVVNSDGIFESFVMTPRGSTDLHIEDLQRLQDPIIKEYLAMDQQQWGGQTSMGLTQIYETLKNFFAGDRSIFVPTVCMKMFQILSLYFPKHHLVLADFDFIPSLVKGENAPTVQEKMPIHPNQPNSGYESIDHDDITTPAPGSCDIFFPTNWSDLHSMYIRTNQSRDNFDASQVKSYKQKDFLKIYAKPDIGKTQTKSNFNPMLHDYTNMSVLVS
ncbi:hypothetical protein PPL_11900 [Heterostelium album PN500]|uniref:Protein arginine methyltransferase NDUFAF7 n=1 Tax=Heterostelium pallidum (strain ATCC 26659 / Pp 5 / PN500) TaxID=670386 RepID=D3BUS8_HETP5|nr:hypothetical protein PPL_11900 [Heterostelium album PN500]EFA74866.1 hypothetical protein PPL_11900 [Heterostelium album PN500]|eukprot:XP_020427000.1 hypothetical protein PPL_11900 [Heterostelium album PN500]